MRLYDDQWIVVTGGAGFIGSAVIKQLNDQGKKNLIVVDELGSDEKWKNLVGKNIADIVDKNRFFNWLEGRENEIEAFIHLGACSSTVETNASFLLENNTYFSQRLVDYAIQNGHRFIYASSAATYGDGSQGFSDDHDSLEQLRPLNMYGFSKHFFDLWLKNRGLLHRVVGLKYFNVFGPNEYHKGRMASAVYHLYPHAKKEGVVRLFKSSEPSVYPNGGQMRDFIYVKDAARMTVAFLENDASGIFNVGRGEPETWNSVADALFSAMGRRPNIEYIDMPPDLIGKYQNYTCADMKKTREVLKKAASTAPLKESIHDYVSNYLVKGAYL